MRSFIISSAFLVVLVQCGYPVAENTYPTPPPTYPTPPPAYPTPPSYPVPKKYPVPPAYPVKPTYPSPPVDYAQKPSYSAAPAANPSESTFFNEEDNAVSEDTTSSTATEYRKRAKARTAHNRHFQRRALQPIRRFQQKKQ